MFAVINVFSVEMGVFLRESKGKLYRSSAYFLGKSIAELPIYILIPIIYVAILWPMADLNMDSAERFATAVGILILVSQVATSFGYLVSCISGNIEMSLSVGPVLVVPFLLMGGFFLHYETVPGPLKWIPYISWFFYAFEGLMVNQWDSVKDGDIACKGPPQSCIPNGEFILNKFSFEKVIFFYNFVSYIYFDRIGQHGEKLVMFGRPNRCVSCNRLVLPYDTG